MKKRRVTARDVAERAGVSQATVSMVLNNYKNIRFSDETKRRILEACDELGYRTFGMGRLNTLDHRILLAVCPSCENSHYVKALDGILRRGRELGYTVLTLCTQRNEESEADVVRVCRELHVAGVLLLYQPNNIPAFQLLSHELPIIQIYEKSGSLQVSRIELDNFEIGRLVAEHFIQLGHRHIAHISQPLDEKQSARVRRVEGLQSAMRQHGLLPQRYFHLYTSETERVEAVGTMDGYDLGYLLTESLLEKGEPVTAISTSNDYMAYGVMEALFAHGKRIPQDYSVCGCDNLRDSHFHRLSLSTVELFTTEKGRDAVDLLVKNIAVHRPVQDRELPSSITHIEYAPRLIVRKSSGRCPKGE